jgi:hypothetical protein
VVEVNEGVGRPQAMAKIIPGDHFSRLLQQQGEDLQRLLLQLHLQSIPAQLSGAKVNLKRPEAASPRCISIASVCAVCSLNVHSLRPARHITRLGNYLTALSLTGYPNFIAALPAKP